MFIGTYILMFLLLLCVLCENRVAKQRKKRYLVFTTGTQFGAFVTVSIPLHPETYTSVAWFMEANYYTIDNVTWYDPLLGDIDTTARKKEERSIDNAREVVTRSGFYHFIESMLERNGYPGRPCLLRAICENALAHFLHNGVVGDLLYLTLTPSASLPEEDLDDIFYKAEYFGLEENCECYIEDCRENPLDSISLYSENTI